MLLYWTPLFSSVLLTKTVHAMRQLNGIIVTFFKTVSLKQAYDEALVNQDGQRILEYV